MPPSDRSDLPFGSEFSPSQIDLGELLEIAEASTDWESFELTVKARYFDSHSTSEYNRRKLANNCKLSMIAYGIIDRNARLTELGRKFYDIRADKSRLYRDLARHILLDRYGLALVQCVLDMSASGEQISLLTLRKRLEERGVRFPRGGKHPSIMRLWLEKAGVFSQGWNVDREKLNEIIGQPLDELQKLGITSAQERAYLKVLAGLESGRAYKSNDLEKMATAVYGVRFDEKNLPKQVLYPLRDLGYINLVRGTKEPGRGAKPFMVTHTDKLDREIVEPFLKQLEKQTSPELASFLRKPFSEIISQLSSVEKHVKGLALEALGFKLMNLIDLRYVATRLRGLDTGGAEVDLIFEGERLVFSRWQIQCKNTHTVGLEDVAKEVGLTFNLKSNVVVIVSTGKIGPEARKYANSVMITTSIDIVMIDRADIERITSNPTAIIDVLLREAKRTMEIKKLDLS